MQMSGWSMFACVIYGATRAELDAEVCEQRAQDAWIQVETAEAKVESGLRALVQ